MSRQCDDRKTTKERNSRSQPKTVFQEGSDLVYQMLLVVKAVEN